MNLREIVDELGLIELNRQSLAFKELVEISKQHPNLRHVQWYSCRECGIRNLCSSPFLPDECISGKNVKAVWTPYVEELICQPM